MHLFRFYSENARWLFGGFLLAFFSGFGQTFFISVWGGEIRGAYGLSHGGFGSVYMAATLASALTLPLVGRLVDVVSVARCATIVIAMLIVACLAMAVSSHVAMLVVTIYLLRLFGQGMMTHTAITAMGRWYAANRGKAVSFASIGHQFSEALMPITFATIAFWLSWRQAWLAAAATLLLIALPAIFALMRVERAPHAVLNKEAPDVTGQRQWTRAEMLYDPLFWLMAVGVLAPAFIGTSIFFHQDYLIELNGWPPYAFYSSLAFMAGATIFVSLLTGFAIDRWSAVALLPIFLLPLALACLVLSNGQAVISIYIAMSILGVSYGMSSPLFGALWPEVYGVVHLGAVRSVAMALMVFSSAAGPGITGLLIDFGVPFSRQLFWLAVFCLAASALMLVARRLLAKRAAMAIPVAS